VMARLSVKVLPATSSAGRQDCAVDVEGLRVATLLKALKPVDSFLPMRWWCYRPRGGVAAVVAQGQ